MAVKRVEDFNAQNLANALWAMAKTGTDTPDIFQCGSPCVSKVCHDTASAMSIVDQNVRTVVEHVAAHGTLPLQHVLQQGASKAVVKLLLDACRPPLCICSHDRTDPQNYQVPMVVVLEHCQQQGALGPL